MNSDVWLNGHHLGEHPSGYTPFYYNLTAYLKPAGQQNVLVVRVNNSGKNSRWYSGSGIYRHVSLTFVNPVHIAPWGAYVTTSKVNEQSATVDLVTTVVNSGNIKNQIAVLTELIDPQGKKIGKTQNSVTIGVSDSIPVKQNITVINPKLWSVEHPSRYFARITIKSGSKIIDVVKVPFGIRSIRFDSRGFALNGKVIKLKGGCVHNDNGPLGSATFDRAEERKIQIMKSIGYNAIRTSHNPPSKQFLDACDRLGMLVMEEAFDMWNVAKVEDDYHLYFKEWWDKDLTAMILRDRNHPSVILWSIGNEITERADPSGLKTEKILVDRVHDLDSTRPVTEGVCKFWEGVNHNYNWEDHTPPVFKLLDVHGYNYEYERYETDHNKYPERIIVGTESVQRKSFENWREIDRLPYVIGDFVWTAIDYIGESALGNQKLVNTDWTNKPSESVWPWYRAGSGDIDITGIRKPSSYYRDVVWNNSKIEMMVHSPIPKGMKEELGDWSWPDEMKSWSWPNAIGDTLQIRVFSRSPVVTLELDGKR